MNEKSIIPTDANWQPKVLIAGSVLGALVGVGAAYLLVQRAEKKGDTVHVGAGEAVKIGVLIFGLLRSIAQL
jgi:hypothetical protein